MSDDRDREYMLLAIEEARKSVGEDERAHPKVGAVVVKDGKVLASAHRGEEAKGDHAEYTALEKKLPDDVVAGATVYTTLEPCTTRNHPKVPCAKRLIERKVKRVVIGMLDPNPDICGKGQRLLRDHNVETDFFPADLMAILEELNRDFTRAQTQAAPAAPPGTQAQDQGHTADLITHHRRRLQVLEKQAAIMGLHTPPHITTEIEDIREKIAALGR